MRAAWIYLRRLADLENGRRKLWWPVFFGLGIGLFYLLPQEPSKWLTLGVLEGLIVLAAGLRFRPAALKILFVLGLIAGGFAWIQARTIYIAADMGDVPPQKLYLKGRIVNADYSFKGKRRLTLDHLYDFDDKPLKGKFRITLRETDGIYPIGGCVELIATLLPRAKAQLPEGYQFDRRNFYQRLSGGGYAESRALPVACPDSPSVKERLNASVGRFRQKLLGRIKAVLPPLEASVAAAVIVGERSAIGAAQMQNYRDSGLAHFLSISGLHMSLVAGLIFFMLRLLMAMVPSLALRLDSKKIAAAAAIVVSSAYLLISGAAVPAQRAFVMTLIVLLGVLFNRRAISMYTVAWAAAVIMLLTPEVIVSASFQMSFAAVIALIAFYEKFAGRLNNWFAGTRNSLPKIVLKSLWVYVIGLMTANLVAGTATLPFAIYHFNRVAVYTSLTNLLSGPVIGLVIMPFVLMSLLLMPFGLEAGALKVAGVGIRWVNQITAFVGGLSGSSVPVLSMPLWGLLLIVLGGLWLCLWQKSWRWWGVPLMVMGFLSIVTVQRPDILLNADGRLVGRLESNGSLALIPTRGYEFAKQIWAEKTASKPTKWLSAADKYCAFDGRFCVEQEQNVIELDGRRLDVSDSEGMAIWMKKPAKIKTVREYIGCRIWNCQK